VGKGGGGKRWRERVRWGGKRREGNSLEGK